MRSTLSGWEVELAQWLKPFLDRLGHKARRRMCPLYVTGLIGPGDRKRDVHPATMSPLVQCLYPERFLNGRTRQIRTLAKEAVISKARATAFGETS